MRPSLLILGIVVLSLAVVVADAQQQTIDSLRRIIQEHKNTRKSLTALVELGTLLAKADPQQAIRYLRAAASFSPAQGNENEICRAANAVGSL